MVVLYWRIITVGTIKLINYFVMDEDRILSLAYFNVVHIFFYRHFL